MTPTVSSIKFERSHATEEEGNRPVQEQKQDADRNRPPGLAPEKQERSNETAAHTHDGGRAEQGDREIFSKRRACTEERLQDRRRRECQNKLKNGRLFWWLAHQWPVLLPELQSTKPE